MSRPRKKRSHPAQLMILLLLLALLAGTIWLEQNRAQSAKTVAAATQEPAATVPPAPSPSPSPTPSPSPSPSPTPAPTPAPTPDTRFHSGDPELDELLYAVVAEQTDPEMSDEEKLHALFQYVAGSFGYLRRNYYEAGDTSWVNAEAMTMLTAGKGNCYNFSSLFYLLARCIGYDAQIYSGTIYGQAQNGETRPPDRPHSWVEINIDGTDYLFDADMQATAAVWRYDESFYKQDDGIRNQYGYSKGEPEEPAEADTAPTEGEDVTEKP